MTTQRETEQLFDAIFPPAHVRNTIGRGGRRSMTHPLAKLCRDVSHNWDSLDESFKTKVKRVLIVDESTTPVRVSLI